ncbi:imm11 family protein [Leptospira noguchii]|uniref:Immunity MXAN-0049 protein domain-containing protein n=1 Tax=Leptospira noguchii TaxID=28182 RepID=M6VBN1_9LEPT|nr:DUF1629 domain-containing protein [Leptospira noguchii]EMO54275.1 hypothetical protein LEP1GSC172_3795 [Leptospira noguchii]
MSKAKQYLLWENRREEGDAFIYGGWPRGLNVSFSTGTHIAQAVPKIEVTLNQKSQGRLTDNVLIAGGGPIFSDRFIQLLKQNGVNNIDTYPCEIINSVTNEIHRNFQVVNIIGKISCIDPINSDITFASGDPKRMLGYVYLSLDESKISDLKLFVLSEMPVQIVVHSEIATAMKDAGITGVEFMMQGSKESNPDGFFWR